MPEAPPRSSFVSILAWVFIALSAGATALSALQNLVLYLVFPRAEMKAALASGAAEQLPWVARVMMSNFELFLGAFLFLSALMLVVSIGLLRRWNWARRLFVIFMALGIVWNVVGIFVQYWLFADVPPAIDVEASAEVAAGMQTLLLVMRIFTAVVAVVMSGIMGWVMWRLTRPAVAAEFGVGVPAAVPDVDPDRKD
jgi:hypothetical protein